MGGVGVRKVPGENVTFIFKDSRSLEEKRHSVPFKMSEMI
jgi:hypothetical protein